MARSCGLACIRPLYGVRLDEESKHASKGLKGFVDDYRSSFDAIDALDNLPSKRRRPR